MLDDKQFAIACALVVIIIGVLGYVALTDYMFNQGLTWAYKACDELCLHSGHIRPVAYNFNNTCTCSDGWTGWFDK
jgi:hypothetical protein